nr:hypothetical protein [uncultured Aminipila sp.]
METKYNIKNNLSFMSKSILSGQSKRSFGLLNMHNEIKFDKLIIKLPDGSKLCEENEKFIFINK